MSQHGVENLEKLMEFLLYVYIYIHVVFVSFFEKKINLPTILGVRVFVFFQETHCFQVDLKKYFSI